MSRKQNADKEDGEAVYSPKQAAVCFLTGMPLLYISTVLGGWLEWIVGGIGMFLILGVAIWVALVVTNLLALAIEGEEFMTLVLKR